MNNKKTFEGIRKGDKRAFSKMITEHDIEMFARITGDVNPVHLDAKFAGKTIFKGKIAHGILIAGLISAALSRFPGVIIYLSQSLYFLKPVRVGDRIEAIVEVLEKADERSELRLQTICKNQMDKIVVHGEARIKVFEVEDSGEGSVRKRGADRKSEREVN